MFNLLVRFDGWEAPAGSLGRDRVFEYTDEDVEAIVRQKGGALDIATLQRLPALFMSETLGSGPQSARVGTLTRIKEVGSDVVVNFTFGTDMPPIPNKLLAKVAPHLGIRSGEFSRTHWAVKDADLFQTLWHIRPRVEEPESWFGTDPNVEQDESLVAVMMPFDKAFDPVYRAISAAAKRAGMMCKRADDIWEHDVIIKDVLSLIRKARVVVCDCTGRNPNVFYEAGIAHTLGRDVVLLTQAADDVPFDLKPLRYLQYANDSMGRPRLSAKLKERLTTILASPRGKS